MNINEKLDIFNKTVMEEASEKRLEISRKIEENISAACEEATRKAKREQSERLAIEKSKLSQLYNKEANDILASERKELIKVRNELISQINENVIEKIKEFKKTPDYVKCLIEKIKDIKYSDFVVVIMKEDSDLKEEIEKETLLKVELTEDDFLGGFKAILKERNALIDKSFKTKLSEEIKDFGYFKVTG